MPVSINGSGAITFNDGSIQNTAATGFGFKNRILNGGMAIDQRNAGASVTPTDGQYCLDRWVAWVSQASKMTVQQSSIAPAGFINSTVITSSSAYTVLSSDYFAYLQRIEGFNCSDLGWGTANAQTVTLSFWVRSSLTGTFGGAISNASSSRSYPFTYTISAANTWEQKSVTIAGDTTGTWLTNNGIGIDIRFGLGVGSTRTGTAGAWAAGNLSSATGAVSVVGTNGATWYITGVQLEKGSTATSFDYRPYGTELALCQRYCFANRSATANGNYLRYGIGEIDNGANMNLFVQYPVSMRAIPSITTTGTASNYAIYSAATVTVLSGIPIIGSDTNEITATVACPTANVLTLGRAGVLLSNNNKTSFIIYSAEL